MTSLKDLIVDMQEEEAVALAKQMLASGTAPTVVLDECREAMQVVGQRFESGEFFVPELILAGDIMQAIAAETRPLIQQQSDGKRLGKVVIGTVEGDIHDVGKDIVVLMLDVNGFDVYDLGIDVPAQVFVDKIKEVQPEVVALSGFLTLAFDSMKSTVEAIDKAGLRDSVKIMVGGGTVDEQVKVYAKADGYGFDAMTAVKLAKQWTEG